MNGDFRVICAPCRTTLSLNVVIEDNQRSKQDRFCPEFNDDFKYSFVSHNDLEAGKELLITAK